MLESQSACKLLAKALVVERMLPLGVRDWDVSLVSPLKRVNVLAR